MVTDYSGPPAPVLHLLCEWCPLEFARFEIEGSRDISDPVATHSVWCEDLLVSKSTAPARLPGMQGIQPAMTAFVVGVVGFVVAVTWLPGLSNSFLLDETLTAWVVQDGLADAFERTVHYQPQPAYNLFMWFWAQLAGVSEIALRIPSLLAAIASCVAIARLGTRLTKDRETGLLAAVVLATSWNVYREAVDARSYMLGLIVLLCLALALIRWIEEGRWRDAWLCGVLAALLPHLHFFFVLCYPGLLVYGWSRRSTARWQPRQFALIASILGIGGVLYVPIALMLAAQGGSYSFVATPSWRSLFEVFVWAVPVAGLLAGLAVVGVFGPASTRVEAVGNTSRADAIADAANAADAADAADAGEIGRTESGEDSSLAVLPRESALLLGVWMFVPLLSLYFVSILSDVSIFLGRYLIPAIPAVSLLYAIAIRRIDRRPARVVAIVVMALASLAIHTRPYDDFRGAARAVNEFVAGDESVPVLLASGLIEGEDVRWLRDPRLADYLNTPAKVYPLTGRLVTLPRRLKNHPTASEIARPILASRKPFVVVEWFGNGARVTNWFLSRAKRAGYLAEPASFGAVRVLFMTPNAAPRVDVD